MNTLPARAYTEVTLKMLCKEGDVKPWERRTLPPSSAPYCLVRTEAEIPKEIRDSRAIMGYFDSDMDRLLDDERAMADLWYTLNNVRHHVLQKAAKHDIELALRPLGDKDLEALEHRELLQMYTLYETVTEEMGYDGFLYGDAVVVPHLRWPAEIDEYYQALLVYPKEYQGDQGSWQYVFKAGEFVKAKARPWTDLTEEEILRDYPNMPQWVHELRQSVPKGFGEDGLLVQTL